MMKKEVDSQEFKALYNRFQDIQRDALESLSADEKKAVRKYHKIITPKMWSAVLALKLTHDIFKKFNLFKDDEEVE